MQLQGLGPLGGPLFASPRGRGGAGPSVSLLIGDPWLGGARAQLDLPYAPRWVPPYSTVRYGEVQGVCAPVMYGCRQASGTKSGVWPVGVWVSRLVGGQCL